MIDIIQLTILVLRLIRCWVTENANHLVAISRILSKAISYLNIPQGRQNSLSYQDSSLWTSLGFLSVLQLRFHWIDIELLLLWFWSDVARLAHWGYLYVVVLDGLLEWTLFVRDSCSKLGDDNRWALLVRLVFIREFLDDSFIVQKLVI